MTLKPCPESLQAGKLGNILCTGITCAFPISILQVTVQGGVHAIVTLGNQHLVMLQEVTSLVDAVSMRS
jgi:hypothetical protein